MKLIWMILLGSIIIPAYGQDVTFTKEKYPDSFIEDLFTKTITSPDVVFGGGGSGYLIVRSTMGSGGSSQTIPTNEGVYYVSQSIGQSSVIGTFSNRGYSISQGYQQPLFTVRINISHSKNFLSAVIFPNPASHSLKILFRDDISGEIFIVMHDAGGRTVLTEKRQSAKVVTLSLNNIPNGIYFLKVRTGNKHLSAKIIKE